MWSFLRLARHPEQYHGKGKEPPFFEGWYFKLVDASESRRYAIIPGVFLSRQEEGGGHAFVQVLDGVTGQATYHRYPLSAFQAEADRFEVSIGPNRFSAQRIALDIASPELTLRGEVRFSETTPWSVTWLNPGIMGWYAWVPFMECYHGVVSLDHALAGALEVNGQHIDLDGGRGYIEKDWGRSFPSGWVWFQSNHFEQPATCITASIAMIPWIGQSFRGFIVGFWHDGALYRFATYTGAVTEKLEIAEHEVRWAIRDRRYRLELSAQRAQAGVILGPTTLEMGKRVPESLQAVVRVRLCTHDGRTIFEGAGRNAGLEVAGDLHRLLAVK